MSKARESLTDTGDTLDEFEGFWRDRYDWLGSIGYQLRPRYKPGWIPSWRGTDKLRFNCEDGITVAMYKVLDAVRVKDGSTVMLKQVEKSLHPFESEIGSYLSSPELASDPRNHCCPILEVLQDPLDQDLQLLVMPLLRLFDSPKLATVGEAVDFFRQTFEGLQFMHEHRVAHRDISKLNVMMDSRPILPNEFHPQSPTLSRDLKHFVSARSRTRCPVKYYFIDFGHARKYGPDTTNPLEIPQFGGDRTVPEFQHDKLTPRNPFQTDIYYIGNLIRTYFLQFYSNITFMDALIARMVHDEPDKRPTIDEVVSEFNIIMFHLGHWKLRERLIERRDGRTVNVIKGIYHISTRTVPFVLTWRPPIPTVRSQPSRQ